MRLERQTGPQPQRALGHEGGALLLQRDMGPRGSFEIPVGNLLQTLLDVARQRAADIQVFACDLDLHSFGQSFRRSQQIWVGHALASMYSCFAPGDPPSNWRLAPPPGCADRRHSGAEPSRGIRASQPLGEGFVSDRRDFRGGAGLMMEYLAILDI